MRKIKITGYGNYLPKNTVKFDGETRYRCSESKTHLDMAVKAAKKALEKAGLDIKDIDCIVSASAVIMQPIPCNAALIHERIAKGTNIPAMDINTTCTSFLTALDTMSYLIEAGRYQTVLIVSSDVASVGLNENQKESYTLFSDGASAFVITASEDSDQGIIGSIIRTYSEGAHATEIRGGGTLKTAIKYRPEDKADYTFDMKGKPILSMCAKKLPEVFKEFEKEFDFSINDADIIIPHQASKALPLIMRILKIDEGKYVNRVSEFGNMVSVSVPFMLCDLLETGRIKKGDKVLLCGTAAGLTCNIVLLKI